MWKMNGVFVDSNIFLKVLEGDAISRDFLLKLCKDGGIYRNPIVYSEVVYVWVRLSTGMSTLQLKKSPKVIKSGSKEFNKVLNLLDLAENLPINNVIEKMANEIIINYGLLPNDALIAATCKQYGIKKIATFDEDFKRLDFLEIITP